MDYSEIEKLYYGGGEERVYPDRYWEKQHAIAERLSADSSRDMRELALMIEPLFLSTQKGDEDFNKRRVDFIARWAPKLAGAYFKLECDLSLHLRLCQKRKFFSWPFGRKKKMFKSIKDAAMARLEELRNEELKNKWISERRGE